MKKYDWIADYLKENSNYGYYCEGKYSFDDIVKKLRNEPLNCHDEGIKYNSLDDRSKKSFVLSCMSIVFEDWDNREELIKIQNDLYDFDLVKEFNSLVKNVKK